MKHQSLFYSKNTVNKRKKLGNRLSHWMQMSSLQEIEDKVQSAAWLLWVKTEQGLHMHCLQTQQHRTWWLQYILRQNKNKQHVELIVGAERKDEAGRENPGSKKHQNLYIIYHKAHFLSFVRSVTQQTGLFTHRH